jgi:hypothetical protein
VRERKMALNFHFRHRPPWWWGVCGGAVMLSIILIAELIADLTREGASLDQVAIEPASNARSPR